VTTTQSTTLTFNRQKAQQIITGLEPEINLNILKLMGFVLEEDDHNACKSEIRTWFMFISSIRFKSSNKPIPRKKLFRWLYSETFKGSELANVEGYLHLLSDKYTRNTVRAEVIAENLKFFYEEISSRIADSDPGKNLIDML